MIYNKVYEYGGYKFDIQVETNTSKDKRVDGGNSYHTITVTCKTLKDYFYKEEVEGRRLVVFISLAQNRAKQYVDSLKLDNSSERDLMKSLGFN